VSAVSRRIYCEGEINDEVSREVLEQLYEIRCEDPGCDIEFVINSQGGNVIEGSAIYSELYSMSRQGFGEHWITTVVRGMAGSIATLLVQAGDNRIAGHLDIML
jgi:ATP-dependent protease ClpP protease subunit